jgi:hypothetical protein
MRSATDFLGHSHVSPSSNRHDQTPSILSRISAAAKRAWAFVLSALEKNNEPHIWVKRDRHGNLHWHVYDPMSDRSWVLSSEDEVRIYLEERFNF